MLIKTRREREKGKKRNDKERGERERERERESPYRRLGGTRDGVIVIMERACAW